MNDSKETSVTVTITDINGYVLSTFVVAESVPESCVPRQQALATMIRDSLENDGFAIE